MDLNPDTYRPYRMTMGSKGSSGKWLVPVLYLLAFLGFVLLEQGIAHSISEDSAKRAAEAIGYSNVEVTARHTLFPDLQGCGKDDVVKFDVTAVDAKGVKRQFFVCDGIFKGATVRFN